MGRKVETQGEKLKLNHLNDYVLLVVNLKNRNFGRLAKLEDAGLEHVLKYIFSDGSYHFIPRHRIFFGENLLPYYRKDDILGEQFDMRGEGPLALYLDFISCGGSAKDYNTQYKRLFEEIPSLHNNVHDIGAN